MAAESRFDDMTLPARRDERRRSFLTRAIEVLAILAALAGFFVFETWPAHPRDLIGFALTVLMGGPLLLFGEYVDEVVSKRFPPDPQRQVSTRRIAWMLGTILFSLCVFTSVWYAQRHYLGDPLGRIEHFVTPHYH